MHHLRKFSHFSDLDETVDPRCLWVVVQRGHFWHRKSPILTCLASETKKRESGGIESEGDLRGVLGGLRSESVIS